MNEKHKIILIFSILIFLYGCWKHDEKPKPAREDFKILWEYQFPVPVYYSSPVLSTDEKAVFIGTSGALSEIRANGQEFVAFDAAIFYILPISAVPFLPSGQE
jgi:hypothetical protein